MKVKEAKPFRVAIRKEGEWVNTYLATTGTMEGAVHIASVKTAIAETDAKTWRLYRELAAHIAAVLCKRAFGGKARVEEVHPEHERAGHG